MARGRKIEVEILGDSRSLERAFSRSSKAGQRWNASIGTFVKGALVFEGVRRGLDGVSSALRSGIAEWSEQAQVAAQTAAGIRSTGGAANVTAKQIERLAGRLQELSGIDDETIQRSENLLLTFKQVRNEIGKGNRIFDRATRAALDLSVRGFGSVESNAVRLGKALADPIRGITALRRAGVNFSDAQRQTIKQLVESNRLLDAQKIILREVESQVGGSARAFGESLPGQIARARESLKNIFGDLVSLVSRPLADALGAFNRFLRELAAARSVRAKLTVVWEGARDAARGAQALLADAVGQIDFRAVFAEARGIADGLQARLEDVDFSFVGREIGDAIKDAVRFALPAAKDLAERINRAVRAIDFEALGRQLGPALATAVVTAFATLLDPEFWVRNWDLALSVAFVAFTGPIGRLAGKLAAPFARLGSDAVLAIVGGLERLSPRLAGAVLALFLRLPSLVARALAPLAAVVSSTFGRLGRLASFTVKVLGVEVVIQSVTNLARRVASVFANLGATVGSALDRAFDALARKALEAAIKIIEPFTHIPGFLGGGAFRRLQQRWQTTLAVMEARANTAAANIQDSIDRLRGRTVEITIVTKQITDAHDRAAAGAQVARRGRDAAARAAANAAKGAQETARSVSASAADAESASDKARAAFQRLLDALELRLDKAEVTKGLRDDLAALAALERAVRDRIRAEGRTTELERKLFEIEQRRADLQRQQRERLRELRRGRQFEALGLTAEGAERVPGVEALSKRLRTLRAQVKGTFLDTDRTRQQLAQMAKVLSGAFGAVGRDVRQAILQMFNDLASALEGGTKTGPQTKFVKRGIDKMLEGLGLSPEQVKELRQRFSQLGAGGVVPRRGVAAFGMPLAAGAGAAQPVEVNVFIDGEKVEPVVTRRQQRRRGRRAASRRGVRPGV